MPRRRNVQTQLPSWLWFFVALPLGLVAVLLWQRQRIAGLTRRAPALLRRTTETITGPRYVEPDSIPIDVHLPEVTEPAAMEELPLNGESIQLPEIEAQPATNSEPAAQDDLEIIEGIGPRIAALLKENGIATFRALADATTERLDDILTTAKLRRIADPSTWSEQARMAAEGNDQGLAALQASLRAGRRKPAE